MCLRVPNADDVLIFDEQPLAFVTCRQQLSDNLPIELPLLTELTVRLGLGQFRVMDGSRFGRLERRHLLPLCSLQGVATEPTSLTFISLLHERALLRRALYNGYILRGYGNQVESAGANGGAGC